MAKLLVIGTCLIVLGGALLPVLTMLGIPDVVVGSIGIPVAIIGFCIQMYVAWNMKLSSDREARLIQQRHEELMRRVRELPPEEAIELLLKECR